VRIRLERASVDESVFVRGVQHKRGRQTEAEEFEESHTIDVIGE
jgi:hypothetical protein